MARSSKVNGSSIREQALYPIRFIRNDTPTLISRAALIQALTGQLPELDIDKECRYPPVLTINHYQHAYERWGVGTRVVSIHSDKSWQMEPDIYETENLDRETAFEKAWDEMKENLHILTHLQTADEVSGIGEFGVVLLGFDDGAEPDKPVAGIRNDGISRDNRFRGDVKLNYVRSLSQKFVKINKLETDPRSRRFGLPTEYQVTFSSPSGVTSDSNGREVKKTEMKVHWSRVLHLADGLRESMYLAVPRLRPVYNRVFDIQKILGGNGQGYWQGGFPGLSIETQTGIEAPDFDKEATKEEIRKYMESQQRYLALEGLTAKSLTPQIADPKNHYETQLSDICATIDVPTRVFKGTEEAKLASSQDMRTWNKTLVKRQNYYITPFILRPFFERMFLVGALPKPSKFFCVWPDLNAPSDNDRASNAQKITDALFKYVSGNISTVIGPKEYLVNVLGYSIPKADAILKAVGKEMLNKLKKLVDVAATKPTVGAQSSKKPPKKTKKAGASEGAGPAR